MRPPADSDSYLALFAHVATRAEADLDLAQAALLVAEPEYPGLDIARYVSLLDKLADEARRRVVGVTENPARRLGRLLYEEVGFEGNERDYYDPRNSFLNEVLDRRTGIPVTLAVVYIEVARRAGVEVKGIGFPGHFLVQVHGPRKDGDDAVIADPFSGKVLGAQDLRGLVQRATGEAKDPDRAMLEPIGKRQILVRLLTNLRHIFERAADSRRLRRTLEQLSVLTPQDERLRRELTALGGRVPSVPTRPAGRAIN